MTFSIGPLCASQQKLMRWSNFFTIDFKVNNFWTFASIGKRCLEVGKKMAQLRGSQSCRTKIGGSFNSLSRLGIRCDKMVGH